VLRYRELQILSRYYNLTQQNLLIGLILLIVQVTLIISIYLIVSSGNRMPIVELFMFTTLAVCCLLVDVVYSSFLCRVHSSSKDVVESVKAKVLPKTRNKYARELIRRYQRSMRPMKTYVGYSNYIDEKTTLNLLGFCVDQIVNLLMM